MLRVNLIFLNSNFLALHWALECIASDAVDA